MHRQSLIILSLLLGIFLGRAQNHGEVLGMNISSDILGEERRITIYLPPGYDDTDEGFEVLYLQDGQNLFDASRSYAGEWKVDEALDSLQLPIIVVGIDHGGDKRIQEYTAYEHPKYGGGGAMQYLSFLIEEVKPRIDSTFRTLPDASHTGIGGSSLGGILAFYAWSKYPEVFGKALVFSPSFWYASQYAELAKETAYSEGQKLFMATGMEEEDSMLSGHREIAEIMATKPGVKMAEKICEGQHHNEKFWSLLFPEAVLSLYGSSSEE